MTEYETPNWLHQINLRHFATSNQWLNQERHWRHSLEILAHKMLEMQVAGRADDLRRAKRTTEKLINYLRAAK